jgi:hypothetical protein
VIQRPSLAPGDYKVPERSGEVLIDPPLERLPALLDAGREQNWGRAEILGTALAEFRRQVRDRALSLAACPAPVDAASPLVVMGHQPLFFHPGVWFKFFLLTCVQERWGATGLHLVVDTDASGSITAEIPARAGELTRRTEMLLDLPPDVPIEAAPLPTEEVWRAFCARVDGHLATLGSAAVEIRANFDAFAASAAQARERGHTCGQFFAGARRIYEARATPPRYAELTVSMLSDTREFTMFALHLLQDPAGFRTRYNASLDEYRRRHRLRSPANPFPNLDQAGDYQEAPFWVVRGGRRQNLFAQRCGERLRLRTPEAPLLDLPAGPAGVALLRAASVRIRPKAVTLTMFARLCLGDLFIHGVGGGRYDRITDAVLAEVFGCAPPPYLVATATLMLPLSGTGTVAEDGRALERRLMDLRHNPERYLAASSEAQRRLVDEKWSLIRAIEQMRPGPERRAATRRIREVNGLLAEGLAGEIHRVQATLATLGRSSAAQDAASYRGYPFFLFDPARVSALARDLTRPI